ncbi:hypothetical protein [Parafrankia sp. FMc2]|uniref:hypothetical protein n=1 Tax=Parafrankia sp. FMc2 TaxID=3233196 RepID=UPI0034D52613
MTSPLPNPLDLKSFWPGDLSADALDYADDVTDEGDTVLVNAYSGPEGLRAAIATGKPVRFWARDSLSLTAEDIAEAERTAREAGWLTELPLDRPWGWVVPPDLAGEYL